VKRGRGSDSLSGVTWFANEILAPAVAGPALHAEAAQLPPEDFLRALRGLARRHDTTVAYGFFSTWGGCNELEYAWVFGAREAVLINTSDDPTHLMIEQGVPARS